MFYNMQRKLANLCTCCNLFYNCNGDHLITKTISTLAQTIFIFVILYAMTYQALSFLYQKIHTVLSFGGVDNYTYLVQMFPPKENVHFV